MAHTTDSAGQIRSMSVSGDRSGRTARPLVGCRTPGQSGSLLGYARISKATSVDADGNRTGQVLDRQVDELTEAGCARIFSDEISGMRSSRPGMEACLDYARGGDTIVVVEISRLGRRTADVVRLIEDLDERDVGLRILNLGLDTSDSQNAFSRAFLQIAAVMAGLERDMLIERTRLGLAAAAKRGRHGGRPRSLSDAQVQVARDWVDAGQSYAEVGRLLGVSERTVRRHAGGIA